MRVVVEGVGGKKKKNRTQPVFNENLLHVLAGKENCKRKNRERGKGSKGWRGKTSKEEKPIGKKLKKKPSEKEGKKFQRPTNTTCL